MPNSRISSGLDYVAFGHRSLANKNQDISRYEVYGSRAGLRDIAETLKGKLDVSNFTPGYYFEQRTQRD